MTDDLEALPEYRENPFIARLPTILSETEAYQALAAPPRYHEKERILPDHIRVHLIMRLAHYFEPLTRHLQLEQHFSLLIRQGYLGRNPRDGSYLRHLQDSHDRVVHRSLAAGKGRAPSTAASFALIGCSGIGKTRTVDRILGLYQQVIHHTEPYSFDQVVWLKLDSPNQGSPKQLCINFFTAIDSLLGTEYLREYRRHSLDEMMSHMAGVADLHALGVLIVDEIQHLNRARGTGKEDLLNFLVTLDNTIGIPIIVIGTLGAVQTLQGDFRQARRASGLGSMVWERLARADGWDFFVNRMWRYQWTREFTPLTEELLECLYEESQGIIDVVVKLFMLAQMRAISLRRKRERPESLDPKLFRQIARENFKLISPMINALKRGDQKEIRKYDDIRPFHDHMEQVFRQAIGQVGPSLPADLPTTSSAGEGASSDPIAQVRAALAGLNLPRDTAEAALALAISKAGTSDPMALMTNVLGQLRDTPVTSAPPPKRRAKKAPAPEPANDDLRVLVKAGNAAGLSGYQALAQAGMIRPVLEDFPV